MNGVTVWHYTWSIRTGSEPGADEDNGTQWLTLETDETDAGWSPAISFEFDGNEAFAGADADGAAITIEPKDP